MNLGEAFPSFFEAGIKPIGNAKIGLHKSVLGGIVIVRRKEKIA